MKFWQKHNLESYADFGYVEVSTDGTNWARLFFATGFDTTWREQEIDDWLGGHELGHAFGRYHAEFCGARGGQPYPYPDGRISPTLSGDSAIYGFDTFTRAIYEPSWKDVMTYCNYLWVSDFTYEGLLDFFRSGAGAGAAAYDVNPTDRLLVVGTIDPETSEVDLQPLFVIPEAGALKERIPGDYALVLRDDTGNELARYAFTPDAGEGGPGDPEREVAVLFIHELVPYDDRTARVDIEGPGGLLLESLGAGTSAPTVQILSSAGGSSAEGETVTLIWEANDPDGSDTLFFNVQYSADGGASWETVEQNIPQNPGSPVTSVALDLANLTPSVQPLFRVFVTDGIHTSGSAPAAAVGAVPNRPPAVRITQVGSLTCPPENATCDIPGPIWTLADGSLTLSADASDPDAPVARSQVQWLVDGTEIGQGASVTARTCTSGCPLSLGAHTITVTVDDGEYEATDQVAVEVAAQDVVVKCHAAPDPTCPDQLAVEPRSIACRPNQQAAITIRNRTRPQAIGWSATAPVDWVVLTASGDQLTVQCVPRNLAPGRYTASIPVTSPDTYGQTAAIVVQLTTGCAGDCDGSGTVGVNELVTGINAALGKSNADDCPLADPSGDREVTIDELIEAVGNALQGCPGERGKTAD